MSLENIQQTLLGLLNKANEKGAFNLEESNAAILSLNGLAQLINQQNATVTTLDESDPLPPDPSKPKP